MAYCSAAEVASDFKDIEFTSSTNVTATDVAGFITEADALINTYLGRRYAVPVTGSYTDALALLKLYSRALVADRIRGIMEVKQATNKDGNQNVRSGLNAKDIIKLLTDLRDDVTDLPGVPKLVTNGGFYSNNAANNVKPVMQKGTKQW